VSEPSTKWLLGAVAICLAILIWRIGSPLQLQIVGPFQSGGASGIPLALNMSTPADARYDVEVATDSQGVLITKIDKYTGSLEIYRVDADGKLKLSDRK
jgi:hypothetical protein